MKRLLPLFFMTAFMASAQTKPTLTIMSFTEESNAGEEALMVLLARAPEIRNAFNLVALDDNFNKIIYSIPSDASTNALKTLFHADFAIVVQTERVGSGNIAFLSIVDIGDMRLLSGDYRKFIEIKELRLILPEIVGKFVQATRERTDAPKLVFLPFYTGVNGLKAETVKYAAAIELANSGKYAVFPWSVSINKLDPAMPHPYSGIVNFEQVKRIGTALNVPYILKGDVLSLGTVNLFLTSVLNTSDASFFTEGEKEFRVFAEDLAIVPQISAALIQNMPDTSKVSLNPAENMVKIEGGVFTMGSPSNEPARDTDESAHQVAVGGFLLSKFEVTQAEYESLIGNNPSAFKRPDFPVEQVSWLDAVIFCNAKSERENLTPVYTISESGISWNHDADGYRLPTEAEWEYACRSGTATVFSTGAGISSDTANFDGRYPYNGASKGAFRSKTMPVGSFAPNAWGVYDMHGNVYEWCWDQYKAYAQVSMDGALSADSVIRGGSWDSEARFLRS
ncbi:MAG: formylglycine-generating enzyme family protein, partial [Treponema sp.]|nr:formylglycine-generating enzyme family protein [Treponema sp.]